jgi:hypothetical protein
MIRTTIFGITAYLLAVAGCPAIRGDTVWIENEADWDAIVRLRVTLADELAPALKHRLLYRPIDLVPGNAATYYRRVTAENYLTGSWRRAREKFGDEVDSWYTSETSLSELPQAKVREAIGYFDEITNQFIRPGTLCRDCDWALAFEDVRGLDVISFLLPEFQATRDLSRILSLRTRLFIAEGRYDEALDHLRMNYRLAQHTAIPPILVCGLIGIAEAGVANSNVLDLIGAPGSPNLYWALTEMPEPFISLREALRLEMSIGLRVFPMLEDAETAVRAPEEWNRLWREGFGTMQALGNTRTLGDVSLQTSFGPLLLGLAGYTHAKNRLVEQGMKPAEVEQMSTGHVLALYSARVYQVLADEFQKASLAPFTESQHWASRAHEALQEAGMLTGGENREIIPLASMLLPAVYAARTAEVRLERDSAALRVIEALRMHAARNGGRWPTTLREIVCVPVPNNPATEQPFEYHVEDRADGAVAVLDLPRSDGIHHSTRYEMSIVQ